MLHRLSDKNTILNQFVAEIRDVNVQSDRMRFRKNLERIGQVIAYEISSYLTFESNQVETPLGISNCELPSDRIVLATILRAGLPLHNGLLSYFDKADNAFVSAYRQHHKDGTFEIKMQYMTCPSIEDAILVISDPMLATGASMQQTISAVLDHGKPKQIHIAIGIASSNGINYIERHYPDAHLWVAAEDEELTAKSYIVPGLGDAGDLAYGSKLQD
ncbi:MAG: uracil phosphoribosyltransferase [Saprospiraceae bacterium]|nr:uracil phosphoribosyltransferase [Saprospiraceae bacterium]